MGRQDLADALGQRMKRYEEVTTSGMLIPGLPLYARVDGRHFSKFTKDFGFPYKELTSQGKCGFELTRAMQDTAKALCKEFNCSLVETHSDELSLGWTDIKNAPFDGRLFKLVSNIASYAGVVFFNSIKDCIPDKILKGSFPSFDCRVFQTPDMMELANLFVWRQNDCMRGCLNQYSQQFFSHKQLQGKDASDRHRMLTEAGHDYEGSVASEFRYGFFYQRKVIETPMPEEYKKFNPGKDTVLRTIVEKKSIPFPISTVENKVQFLFEGSEPTFKPNKHE